MLLHYVQSKQRDFFIDNLKQCEYENIISSINIHYLIQSNLVISNSLISNFRLSRSENLVPVLTWNFDNR